jgi:hypothetical protein
VSGMSDDYQIYQRACERTRQRYAELRAEEVEPPKPQQQESTSYPLTDAQQVRVDGNPFTETQSEALAEVIVLLRQEWEEHVAKELGELRAELEVLRGVVKSNNVELIKRSRNAG